MKPLISNDLALDVSIKNMLMKIPGRPERVVQFYKYEKIRELSEINNLLNNADKIYVSADFHLNKPKRMFEGIADKIKERHNSIVTNKDVFIFLGDLADPEYPLPKAFITKYIKSLNGKKIMILGNNDLKDIGFYRNIGFDYVIQSLKYKDMIFTHFPYETNMINIHGHIHGAGYYLNVPFNKHKDCYIDNNNFFPYELNYIRNMQFKGINVNSRPLKEGWFMYNNIDQELNSLLEDAIIGALNEAANQIAEVEVIYDDWEAHCTVWERGNDIKPLDVITINLPKKFHASSEHTISDDEWRKQLLDFAKKKIMPTLTKKGIKVLKIFLH